VDWRAQNFGLTPEKSQNLALFVWKARKMDESSTLLIYSIGGSHSENTLYTQSNVYTKKTSSILLLSILLVSAIIMLIPVGVVHATITGTPVLGVADHSGTPFPTAFTAVGHNVSVIAGTASVAPVATGCDHAACPYAADFLGINFAGVVFSGAQFYLYMSTNGFSSINTTGGAPDIKYAGPFSASDLTGAGKLVGGYWIGTAGGSPMVIGPIPIQISTAYQYIKVYDGSCGTSPTFCGGTGVAGAKQLVLVQPGITITPTKGPAWTGVTVSGGGFQANKQIDINYSFTYFAWETAAGSLKTGTLNTAGIPTNQGWFTNIPLKMVDTAQAWNINGGPFNPTPITLTAVNSSFYQGSHDEDDAVLNSAQNSVAPVLFNEFARQFNQMSSYFSGSTIYVSGYAANAAAYGNATCMSAAPNSAGCAPAPKYSSLAGNLTSTYLHLQPLQVYVTGTVGIVGSNFTISGTVSIWLGGILAGTVTADTSGHFMANVTVPKLPVGLNVAKAVANGVDYQFDIYVNPTLILTPDNGPVSPVAQVVTATAYGFPANSWVSLWWYGLTSEDTTDIFLLNSTVDSTGSYNHTITFTVPHSFGGPHDVSATTHKFGSPISDSTLESTAGFVTESTFTVTPTMFITPTSTPDNGTVLTVVGEGFVPADEEASSAAGCNYNCLYTINIDNAAFQPNSGSGARPEGAYIGALSNGDMNFTFYAAGFRPGLHVVTIQGPYGACVPGSECDQVNDPAMATDHAFFTITTTGDPISDQLTSLNTAVTGLSTSLTSIQTSLTAVQTSLSGITSSLTAVQSSLTSITSSLTGITSSLTSITSTLTGISGSLSSIQASLTTVTGDVSGLGSQLTSIQQSATAIQSAASSLTTSVGNLGTQLTSVQNTLTSMQGQLTTIQGYAQTAATQATNGATSAANAVTGNSTAQTYVLVVAVLAAITLVLELAILVRKLS
jgi:hypothetical protein